MKNQWRMPAGIGPLAVLVLLAASPALTQRGSAGAVRCEDLTRQQIKSLPDSQLILCEGREFSAGEARKMDQDRQRQLAASAERARAEAQRAFEAARQEFLAEQDARRRAHEADIQREMTRLRGEGRGPSSALERIREEAVALRRMAQTASPGERRRIEQRARELLEEARRAGAGRRGS